jgi:hypothetical protein
MGNSIQAVGAAISLAHVASPLLILSWRVGLRSFEGGGGDAATGIFNWR